MLAGIDREECEAGGEADVDVGGGLEVVGVGAKAVLPALGEHAPERVVHHLLRSASAAHHLADRLLGKDRRDLASGGAKGANVAWSCEPEPVAEPRRGLEAERPRAQPRQQLAQRRSVALATWADQ